ncbi:FAD-dependent monooxygenase [Bordetella bronchiseptica]|uniref:FAD-dependent monooxygenase n=1 Tax=Bordetella bronchiseptica TaxID=518 RepID=UPI0004A0CDD1|nr:FAD-dependent monooxygenase [Bordetella bronchiseptica]KDB57783.1 putative 3-hydroxybenzoate 6-hydroxylase 1 [Bordetella bronchiseptica A1-7]KDB68498.1 putative 3-hydroxybenzoate 6-hydroxylase 1 [Bordetella bronchiseptica B20-10725633]
MRVIIAGCGIGGAALAVALEKFKIDHVVLEQAPRLEEVGAGVQLSPNGVAVLQHLGVHEALSKVAFEPRDLLYRDWQSGQVLMRNPLMPTIKEHFGAPYYHAHRADLLGVLTERLDPAKLRLGSRIVDIEQEARQVTATLADGTRIQGDILVGADGIHSLVRSRFFQADQPQASGCIAWRGIVDADAARHLDISPSAHLWLGPERSAVIYYVSGGRKINWICIGSRPGDRKESWSATTTVDEVLREYAGWNEQVTGLIRLTDKPFVTALYDRAPLDSWINGRIALLGDSAHAMLPYHAQGAVQSMEDAWVLARTLQQSGGDIPPALERYQSLRKDRTARVQAQSQLAEKRFHMSDPEQVARRNQKFLHYNAQYRGTFLPQQEWLFGYDADKAALGTDDAWRALRAW